ncbi:MAG: RHS repeat-associated core domain-containing protein [Candidatus Acidiferrales bacterium]
MATAAIRDPQTGTTTTLRSGLHEPRAWHTATVLPNGTVLIFGGVGANGHVQAIAELFDPTTQKFTNLPPVGLTPRAYHTATLLTDGRILIAGGVSATGETLGSIEAWNFQTNTAMNLPPGLLVPRRGHTATLLADGTVLFWGGYNAAGAGLNFGEVFDPVTQRTTMETTAAASTQNTQPPQLEASLPPDDATNVPVNSLIALRFSKPLSVVTVNTQTVVLSGSQGPVIATVVPAEGGMLAFVTPDSAMVPGTTYTVSLSGLTDGANALNETSISFTTAGTPPDSTGGAPEMMSGADPDDTGNQAFKSPWLKLPSLEAPSGVTAVAGRALRLNGLPLENVTLTIGGQSAKTDRTGRFLLANVGSGHQVMLINGQTANTGDRTYGIYEDGVNIVAGQTYTLPYTIWMTSIDTQDAVTIPSPTVAQDTVITTPRLPGLELHLAADTVIYDHEWNVARTISITPIPLDKPPFPLPQGVQVPIYFTIQPGGGYIEVGGTGDTYTGARLFYPNTYHDRPGAPFDFWNYDAKQKGWYVYGEGKVSQDGLSVVPNPGVEIYEFTGAMVGTTGGAPTTGSTDPVSAGEPVDLSSGLFHYEKTDLVLPDVVPLVLQRVYRTNDSWSRPFGIGTSDSYEMFLTGDTNPYSYMQLILPDGSRVYFYRTSSGTGYGNAVYAHTSTHSEWYGATITWNVSAYPGADWVLRKRDGTNYYFPESEDLTNPPKQALIGIGDRYGNTVQIHRDSNGNVLTVVSPNLRVFTFWHDSSNRITQAVDSIGRAVSYTYDSSGRLSTVTDANGGVTTYTYDSNNNMLTIKDARGITYLTNQYDSNHRVTQQTLADGSTYQFAWTAGTSTVLTSFVDGSLPPGGSSSAIESFRTCTTCSEGYMPLISQVNVTDPRGVVRQVQFGSTGQMTSDTYALGKPEQQTFTYTYYADNLVESVTDQLGRTTNYSYDANGNVTSINRTAGTLSATTSFTYDPTFSQLTSLIDPLNNTTSFTIDASGNTTSITDPLSHQTTFTFDSEGRPLTAVDPLSHSTQFAYDTSSDLISITDPLSRTISRSFDAAGRLISVANPLGQKTQYAYDNLNQVTQVTDALGNATSLAYDPNGNLTGVTDANSHATSYTYDSMDRLSTRTDPLSRGESYQYDGNGNLTQFTDRRGEATTYTYDNLNRRAFAGFNTQAGPSYESTISYSYDAGNRLTQAVDSVTGTIARTYDGLDDLLSETTPQGGVSYGYDVASRRTSMTVAGQPAVNYSYDNASRLTGVAQGTSAVSFVYDSASRRTSLTLPNGVAMSYSYDNASQLTGINYTPGQNSLGNLAYTYDLAGRRTSEGGSYAAANLPQPVSLTAYDAANELTEWGAATPVYDANGNTLSDGTNSYAWNGRNQLASMNSSAESFQYDPLGRRVAKTVLFGTTNYLYDGANPVQELAGTTPTANLLTGLGIDERFTRTDSSATANFLTDALGSTLALTDPSGNTLASYTYEPFGNTTATGSSASTYQYTGRENDGTGVYYYRARYYSPTLQRFVSEDPIGIVGGINKYAYTLSNPTTYRDPSGLSSTTGRGPCTCLQVFANAFTNPVEGPLGNEVEDATQAVQGGLQAAGAGLGYAAGQVYNQALQYGFGLASSASAAGTISYGLRSSILRGLLNTTEDLSNLAESVTSEAVAGEAGIATVDVLLGNALGAEVEAVRNGTCIPEQEALRIIIFGQ